MKRSLSKKELLAEYGRILENDRAGCSITLKCGFGTISCSSEKGDCDKHYETFELSTGETYEEVTSISCDGKTYSCK